MNWNFSIFLFLIIILTGISRILYKLYNYFHNTRNIYYKKIFLYKFLKQNQKSLFYLEQLSSLFPVLLIVFLLRSFIAEPFRIPSGSMMPTLESGDFILVQKLSYSIKIPIINYDIFSFNTPKRGDIVVFRYPENPKIDYIKRIVGLPGDEIIYRDKKLFINGILIPTKLNGLYYDYDKSSFTSKYKENLFGVYYDIIIEDNKYTSIFPIWSFPWVHSFKYSENGLSCRIPNGNYFVMGDNRDNSSDSRYWGFVPFNNITGKAFLIWMNFNNFKRIGFIK
ncbi:Signal peptidase I [Candidatus Kinetoplastibacterium sorsogonicusi]|uniref:Signal peptidase I n=1 Tax=Candidatus Kinetoplastidibacterium kentomonadis TaxID=1576550 RepID=A0A3S7JA56_9PROT|nr:signal peptidase I [Candidatus Kinetoplastibacterium sorsogonicusi]AWD32553.1 Signal peptidase I [Candidatus Kinetoplastibacterium sorsogonicusi]